MQRLRSALLILLLSLASLPIVLPAAQAVDNDAGTGGDAGDGFSTATPVAPTGRYYGALSAGDEDWFRFSVAQGAPIDIDVDVGLTTGAIQTGDLDRRLGITLYGPNGAPLDSPATNVGDARVTWPRALVGGEYRLALSTEWLPARSYSFCFVVTGDTCATTGLRPIDLLIPLTTTHAEVLLVPPMEANPGGSETPLDYLDAALDGVHRWDPAIDAFTAAHPEYSYLQQLDAHVEVFDGAPERAGYDVIIGWSPYTGPIFRGLASNPFGGGALYEWMCPGGVECTSFRQLQSVAHDGTRVIVMSSFGAAPRGGQVLPDFPEKVDVYNVMMHEFAHTWGLGHSQTWTATSGPDLMNSPYALVYGDGDPLSDGGERTPTQCISSLDLYGLARLYEWVGRGVRWEDRQIATQASLPSGMAYELYC
jgi:hypothetical protein